MKIVADTSSFLAVVLDEPERNRIMTITRGHNLVAPEVLPFELGNALTALKRRGILSSEQILAAWDAVQTIPIELRRIDIRSALEIAAKVGTYAYDAYFLECSLSLRLPLLTLDKGMARIARELNIQLME